ncbi:erythromycin esterase family protein [Streptomyces abyssomicinicus]|uniref:erythromycin esterase family protein n=1 Tax=Streptomyces abyssomicinicus TaxID=574929 RepID=UPI001FEC202D|nr:erythromycin esterase family protein [Streptomyces abyssomicinicus]
MESAGMDGRTTEEGNLPDGLGAWLSANAVPLTTLSADGPLDELEPLRQWFGKVRILGMGESTHGTREFFRLKHRLLRFLVLRMGCTALAMEASESAARAIDAYVHGGPGDAALLVDRLGFWTWRTEEILHMVEWMREHNRSAAEQVSFVGIDPQRCADSAAVVREFLRKVAPEREAPDLLDVLSEARPGSLPDPGQRLRAAADELAAFLVGHREEFAERTTADAADEAAWHAGALARAADLVTRSVLTEDAEQSALAVRDRHMAEAVTSLVDATDGRVAVWGHNGHVGTGTYANGVLSLGSRLRRRHGEAYYALGLLFGKGSFRARQGNDLEGDAIAHRVGLSRRTVESRLAAAVRGDYLADLRAADPGSDAGRWLRAPRYQRSFGSNVPRLTYRFHVAPLVPAQEYDGIAFVARSTCSRPLPSFRRTGREPRPV